MFFRLSLLLLTSTLLISCSGGSEKKSYKEEVYFVKGDPKALIAGAKLNRMSPIQVSNATQWQNYSVPFIYQFLEVEKIKVSNQPLVETRANPDEKESAGKPLVVKQNSDGQWQMVLFSGKTILNMKTDTDGRLEPYEVINRGSSTAKPIEVLHWSTSPDGAYMSFLYSETQKENGRILNAIYFERNAPSQDIPMAALQYVFLFGPGKKVGWKTAKDKDLQVQLCGANSEKATVKNAVEAWNKVLQNRLKVNLTTPSEFAPFSDVNQHCIYYVDTYLMQYKDEYLQYGITVGIGSTANMEILDADIFIFKSEFQKLYKQLNFEKAQSEYNKTMPLVILHELGHLLGLGHKFDGTPSVMSYDFNVAAPTAYDIETMEVLYPIK